LEIEVHNEIVNILNNFQNTRSMSVLEHDYILDFADPSEPQHGSQIVEYITAADKMKTILNLKNALLMIKAAFLLGNTVDTFDTNRHTSLSI